MKRSTRGFVSGFSVALLVTGGWGVFGSGGGQVGMMEFGSPGRTAAGEGAGPVAVEVVVELTPVVDRREEAAERMDEGWRLYRKGAEVRGLEAMGDAVELARGAPGEVAMRLEYAAALRDRGGRLFGGGRREEGATLLEEASSEAQRVLVVCGEAAERHVEVSQAYGILGELSFDAGRDVEGAVLLLREAVACDGRNVRARGRLGEVLDVLEQRGERPAAEAYLR